MPKMIKEHRFAEHMNFVQLPTTVIKDFSPQDDEWHDPCFTPMSNKQFIRDHIEQRLVWWNKTYFEEFYEDIEDLIEHYEDEWEDFDVK